MLRFILGTAGTGKSTRLTAEIKQCVERAGKAVLLVPEQYSFEAERGLYRALGPEGVLGVEVLSFTRLCNAVFRKFGGLSAVAVSDAGKYMMMSVALTELRDTLVLYQKSAVAPAFLETLVSACAEFKTAGISPRRLEELAKACEEGALRDKLDEISRIYTAYQSLLERGYSDPDDDLMRVCALLQQNDFFGGTHVFVDGFTTFMSAEFELLAEIIAQADSVTFAMTADGIHDDSKGTGVFSPVKAAIARLMRAAASAGVPVKSPELCREPHRYRSPVLAHLAHNFLQPSPPVFPGNADGIIEVFHAPDVYREAEYVASVIAELVAEHGYRFNEIAVVARDPHPYLRSLEAMFARYDIPFFADRREEAENMPLIGGVLAALDAVRSNYDPQAVLTFAKNPLCGLDPQAVAEFENYCYIWAIRGSAFTLPFINNPAGLVGEMDDGERELLGRVNDVRERIVTTLAELKEALRSPDGKRFAYAVYTMLQKLDAADNLAGYAQKLPQGERESFLDLSAQLWDSLIEILDVFGSVLGGVGMRTARACELMRLALSTIEVAQVPQTLDEVLVGGADRIRPGRVRAVFVVGANEGVFPPQIGRGGLFTDEERQYIADLGAELSPPTLAQSILERYYAYFALTLPSERLFVSCAGSDTLGREQQPSIIFSSIQTMFRDLRTGRPDALTLVSGERSALSYLSEHFREDTPQTAALLSYLQGNERLLARLAESATQQVHHLRDSASAQALFGQSIRLSPSRIERYYRCPFSYFAADGLSLRKRQKVEFNPLESGSMIHHVLQVMVQKHGGKGLAVLSLDELSAEIREIIEAYIAERVEDLETLPARFRYLFTRLNGMLARLLQRLGREFAQSLFEPVAFELPIRAQDGIAPLHLQTPDGVPVSVEGVIDRVDVMEKNGRRYVRVVDYKSGRKQFQLDDILYGLNMQMLLYLFTLQENGTGPFAGCVPAGVLYMPVQEKFVSAVRGDDADKLALEQEKQWRMNGLLLADEDVLRGMEQDVAGLFIPAKIGKNGQPDAKSSLANKAQMGQLARKVKENIVQMAESLRQGAISSVPVQGSDFDTCQYCEYRSVCGREEGDDAREVEHIDRKSFYKLLEEEKDG